VDEVVEFVHADVRERLATLDGIAFCFLDSEKADYGELYEVVVPRLVPGGLLVADNAVGFEDVMQPMLDGARADTRVDAVVVPFLTGQLLARRRS
jgi:predicted O-methyltransferase YrrM